MVFKKIIFIVGPTAVGKTSVSLQLARKISGEIISCDSMQVYKEISIASNKPSSEDLKRVPHHLVNIVSVKKEFDVAHFRKKAVRSIQMIHSKAKIPIVVGGSGMYMSVLLDGIFEGGAKDLNLRKKLETEAQEKGSEYLHRKLLEVDFTAAQRIHPNDQKRIIRALEVFEGRQKTISSLQKKRSGLWGKFNIKIFALNRRREELYELINQRVEDMFTGGIIEEIKKLSKMNLSKTAQGVIGIKEVQGFLNGDYDIERAKYLLKLNTRRYAKRQLTWFRKDKRLKWIMIEPENFISKIVSRIMEETDA